MPTKRDLDYLASVSLEAEGVFFVGRGDQVGVEGTDVVQSTEVAHRLLAISESHLAEVGGRVYVLRLMVAMDDLTALTEDPVGFSLEGNPATCLNAGGRHLVSTHPGLLDGLSALTGNSKVEFLAGDLWAEGKVGESLLKFPLILDLYIFRVPNAPAIVLPSLSNLLVGLLASFLRNSILPQPLLLSHFILCSLSDPQHSLSLDSVLLLSSQGLSSSLCLLKHLLLGLLVFSLSSCLSSDPGVLFFNPRGLPCCLLASVSLLSLGSLSLSALLSLSPCLFCGSLGHFELSFILSSSLLSHFFFLAPGLLPCLIFLTFSAGFFLLSLQDRSFSFLLLPLGPLCSCSLCCDFFLLGSSGCLSLPYPQNLFLLLLSPPIGKGLLMKSSLLSHSIRC